MSHCGKAIVVGVEGNVFNRVVMGSLASDEFVIDLDVNGVGK